METLEQATYYLPEWRIDKRDSNTKSFIGPHGARIYIKEEANRYHFSAKVPAWPGYSYSSWTFYGYKIPDSRKTRISVAKNRGAKAIALDLERRLIKNYMPMLKEAKRLISEQEAKLAELHNIEYLLKSILQAKTLGPNNKNESSRRMYFEKGELTVDLYSGGKIGMKLNNLTYEEGITISSLIRKHILDSTP